MNLENTSYLETERLVLRRFTENDFDALFKIFSDEEVNTFLPWFPVKTIEETKKFFEEKYSEAYKKLYSYRYAVCLKKDNIPIGYVNVSENKSYDLGYGLLKEFWGKGIITEACEAVVNKLRDDGVPYVTATHDVNNYRSGEVMKRIGMSYKYSYEEQWQPKDSLVTFRMYQLNFDGKDERVYKEYWDKSLVHFIEE